MYKYFKFLTMSILVFAIIHNSNAMNHSINTYKDVFMKIINKDNQNNTNKFIAYNPYLVNSPAPTQEDMLQFMKVKELNMDNYNVKKCFKYLQEYDTQNCLLLDNLLEGIYFIAQSISPSPANFFICICNNMEEKYSHFTGNYIHSINNLRYYLEEIIITAEKLL